MLPASRGVSTVVGMALMILLFLAMVATLIVYMQTIGETYRTLSTILETKLSSSTLSNSITAFWYNDTYGDIVINATNRFSRTVLITSIVTVFENLRIVASRHNQTLEGIEIHVYLPNGNEIYSNPQLPIPLCPGCLATINITKTRDVYEGKLITASLTLSSSPVVAVVPVKYVYEVGGIDEDWLWNGEKLYANPKFKYVGIGTSNPRAALHVNGSVILENLPMASGGSYVLMLGPNGELYRAPPMAAGQDSDWLWNGNAMYANPAAVAVGIGTTSPRAPLHVVYSRVAKYVVKITNPNGYDLVDYQVRIDVSMVAFQNFKIVDSNGNELPYCFEQPNGECNESRSSVIWVKVPYIPANGETILYVENATENHAVPGDQVFDFYDDFSDPSLSKWSIEGDSPDISVETVNGRTVVRIAQRVAGSSPPEGIMSVDTIDVSNRSIECVVMAQGSGDLDAQIGVDDDWQSHTTRPTWLSTTNILHFLGDTSPGNRHSVYLGDDYSAGSAYPQPSTWYLARMIIIKTSSGGKIVGFFNDETLELEGNAYTYVGHIIIAIDPDGYSTVLYVDWIRVRKYADREPLVSIEPVLEKDVSKTAMIIEGVLNATNLTISGIARDDSLTKVLVINDSGFVFWRDVSTIRDNDWLWNGDYLYTTASRVGIGTSTPATELDVVGTIRGRNVTTDYLTISENGISTGWYLDYFPDNERLSIVRKGYGEVLSLLPNGYVGIGTTSPRYRLEVVGEVRISGRLGTAGYAPDNGYPPGWYGGIHTWDVYAEASIGVGAGGGLGVWITHENNNGKIILYANGREAIKLIASEGAIYADYYRFTESGTSTEFELDYFPNTLVGNAIGVSHFDGSSWRGIFFVNGSGYVFAPRYYITEERDEASPRWHIDYVPDNNRLTINYDYGGSPKEVAYVLPSGSVWILGNLSTHGFDPDHGYPRGWSGGLHTWDIYAEGSVGVGRSGQLVAWLGGTWDGQGFLYLNNTNNGAWARISRWTNRLEIASSDEIRLKIGGWGDEGTDIVVIGAGGIDMLGYSIFNVNDIYISGGSDSVGAIYGPDGNPYVVFDVNGMKLNVPQRSGSKILVLDDNGYVGWRDISTLSDNDWFWNGNYLYTNAERVGIGTSSPQYKLDVAGDIRAIGASIHADYFRLTEGGSYTGWVLDYFPGDHVAFVKEGVGEILKISSNRWVNISGWLKVEPYAGSLTSYPSGWGMGVWTWDVYAEGTVGVGRNGEVKAMMNSAGNAYFLGSVGIGTTSPQYKLDVAGDIRAIAAKVYADYFWFTEAGNPTEFAWDYFPNSVNGRNAIGVMVGGTGRMFIDVAGYVYTPRLYITEEGSENSPKWYLDFNPDGDRLDVISNVAGRTVVQLYSDLVRVWTGLDVYGDVWLNDHDIVGVDDLFVSGGDDDVGAIYGPFGIDGPQIVFTSTKLELQARGGRVTLHDYGGGIYIEGISLNDNADRFLVIDSLGRLYYRHISSLSDNDWYWSGNYLRPNDDAYGVDMNNKDIVNVDEIRGSSPTIYASSGSIYLKGSGGTTVWIWNPPKGGTQTYDAVFYCSDGDCYLAALSSSIRYKTDVKPLTTVINTSKIYELEPVFFRWKRTNEPDIGLVAEQVAKVLPILVTFDEEGRPDAVKYKLLPVLMLPELKKHEMSIRWLNETVEDLAKEVEELRNALINNQQNVDRDNASQSNAMELTVWRTLSIVAIALATLSLALSRASRR